jgi:hypothetical protein
MAKEQFIDCKFSKVNMDRLNTINSIIEEYQNAGYTLTLRQLYYQLVSRDIIPNVQSEYSKLSTLLKNGRMAGIVDWDAIEDRVRVPYIPWSAESASDAILKDAKYHFRLNRQLDQKNYVEVWIEKDALSGILRRITSEYHVHLMVNRGYSSCSAMHEAHKRIRCEILNGKKCTILYLGDHDPSGLDMIRDIKNRFKEFNEDTPDDLNVKHIALTTEQVYKYQPPENPAKLKDPRAKGYVENFGYTSWEVDALNPKVLTELLKSEIESVIDMNAYQSMKSKEEKSISVLYDTAKDLKAKGY